MLSNLILLLRMGSNELGKDTIGFGLFILGGLSLCFFCSVELDETTFVFKSFDYLIWEPVYGISSRDLVFFFGRKVEKMTPQFYIATAIILVSVLISVLNFWIKGEDSEDLG